MTPKEQFQNKIVDLDKATALSNLYMDVCDMLEKYEAKLTRQYNDADKTYKRLKKSGASTYKVTEALKNLVVLKHQILIEKDLRIEMLQRYRAALEENKKVKDDLISFCNQLDAEDTEDAKQK